MLHVNIINVDCKGQKYATLITMLTWDVIMLHVTNYVMSQYCMYMADVCHTFLYPCNEVLTSSATSGSGCPSFGVQAWGRNPSEIFWQ